MLLPYFSFKIQFLNNKKLRVDTFCSLDSNSPIICVLIQDNLTNLNFVTSLDNPSLKYYYHKYNECINKSKPKNTPSFKSVTIPQRYTIYIFIQN